MLLGIAFFFVYLLGPDEKELEDLTANVMRVFRDVFQFVRLFLFVKK